MKILVDCRYEYVDTCFDNIYEELKIIQKKRKIIVPADKEDKIMNINCIAKDLKP